MGEPLGKGLGAGTAGAGLGERDRKARVRWGPCCAEVPVKGSNVWDRCGTQTKLGQWEAVAEAADEAARPKLGEDNTDAELGLGVYRSLAT